MRGTSESPRAALAGAADWRDAGCPHRRGRSKGRPGRRGYARLAVLFVLLVHLPGQTEVDDLDVALTVDQDVRRLQVAVDDVPALVD